MGGEGRNAAFRDVQAGVGLGCSVSFPLGVCDVACGWHVSSSGRRPLLALPPCNAERPLLTPPGEACMVKVVWEGEQQVFAKGLMNISSLFLSVYKLFSSLFPFVLVP